MEITRVLHATQTRKICNCSRMKAFSLFHSQPEFLVPPGVESLRLDRGGPYELGRQSVRDDAIAAHAVFPLQGGAQLLQACPPLAPKAALRVELLV